CQGPSGSWRDRSLLGMVVSRSVPHRVGRGGGEIRKAASSRRSARIVSLVSPSVRYQHRYRRGLAYPAQFGRVRSPCLCEITLSSALGDPRARPPAVAAARGGAPAPSYGL